jgi:beta-galactosidase
MPRITRRTLLGSGIALSTSSLVDHSALASVLRPESEQASPPAPAGVAGQRERLLFDFGWKFTMGHGADPTKDLNFGYGQGDFSKTGTFAFAKVGWDDSAWRGLNLPHDWAVELPFEHDDSGPEDEQMSSHGYKPLGRRYPATSVGWYRREFDVSASDAGRRIVLEFDGVFRDTLVFANGCFVGRHNNGYTPFSVDLSDFLRYGAKNCLVIRADASFGDGWFYEGAGIYRHVWLTKMNPVHVGRWESTVRSTVHGSGATLALATLVENEGGQPAAVRVRWTIRDATGAVVAQAETPAQAVAQGGSTSFAATTTLPHAELWSPATPHLYTATVSVEAGGMTLDTDTVSFGIRTAAFDAAKGFSLNGTPMKIQGTCNHQDHAGVGVALPDRLQEFRLEVLRTMGCNAVRTSHNMPTPEWVEACDRLGVMMMCETRQMSSSAEGLEQLAVMVKRYRNSPSIILWSIGNEEYLLQDQMAEQGARIAASMVRRCHALDPTRAVTAAVNFNNEGGVSVPLDVVGFNYNTKKYPEAFHAKHPERPVFGSETSSAISTRGEYATDPLRNLVNSYDGVVPWGETPEGWWTFYGSRAWEAGGFAWTGFDYRGEPTPYGWPSINSQFGIVDMCGFPKDYFFYYQAWWQPKPVLHLFPHWNWHGREGDEIAVWVYTNLDAVELLVNGKSVGTQQTPHLGHLEWRVRYEPGVIEARGTGGGTVVLTDKRETTGETHTLRLTADRPAIHADGEDVVAIKVEALDTQGRWVPTAKEMVSFTITGEGHLLGVGNGDPNCQESDKQPKRSLFNGLAQVLVQSTKTAGDVRVEAKLEAGTPAVLVVKTDAWTPRPAVL